MREPAVFRVNDKGKVEVDPDPNQEVPYLPLIASLNFRSAYNKADSFRKFIRELGVQALVGVETWEREKYPLEQLLSGTGFEIISKCRQKVRNNQPGGGVCILVNPDKFFIAQPKVLVPEGVEVVWCVISPKNTPKQAKIKNICILFKLLYSFFDS